MKKMIWMMAVLGACAVDPSDELTTEQGVAGTNVWHAVQKGQAASTSLSDGSNWYGYLTATEYGSGADRLAYAYFSAYSPDLSSQTCYTYDWGWGPVTYCYVTRYFYDYGWGQIAGSAFKVNPQAAKLSTTAEALGAQHCTIDYSAWSFLCEPVFGPIEVTWNADGAYSQFSNGITQTTYGAYTFKTQGQNRMSSAQAAGQVLGHTFSGRGAFADSKGTSVTHDILNAM